MTNNIFELRKKLNAKFQGVYFEMDMITGSRVLVPLGDESEYEASVEFSNTQSKYHVKYIDNNGNFEMHLELNFDELVASLIAHGAQPRK